MNKKNEHLDCCEFYWRSACTWKRYTIVERIDNEDGAPIALNVVKGESAVIANAHTGVMSELIDKIKNE